MSETTSIELGPNSAALISVSMSDSDLLALYVVDRSAKSCFGLSVTPDTARQLAAALVAHADALDTPTIPKGITA